MSLPFSALFCPYLDFFAKIVSFIPDFGTGFARKLQPSDTIPRAVAALIRPAGFGAGPQKSGSEGLRTAFP